MNRLPALAAAVLLGAAWPAFATEVVIQALPEDVPQPARVDPRPPQPSQNAKLADAAEVESRVRSFLDRFVDPDKSPQEMASLFTDDVEFYDQGRVGRDAIARDVARYARHWPQRRYAVDDVQYIVYDPLTDRAFVAYRINYEVASSARRARGQAEYGAVLTDLEQAPKVAWIKERLTRRAAPAAE